MKRAVFAFVLVLAAAMSAPLAQAQTTEFAPQATSFTLANGLQVVVIPDHRAPIVTHMVWYKAGAGDEVPGKSGIAHFVEHLMFKGTSDHPAGEFSRVVTSVGGNENAFTTNDYTAFYQNVAKQHLGLMMQFEADRMANLVLTDEAVLPERDVIREERRQRIDNDPGARLGVAMNAALFQNSHYGIPTIGWDHEMAQLTRDDAIAWYNRYYTPNNAVVVIAGDVTEDEVRKLAEDTYGKVARRFEPPPRDRAREPEPFAARTVTLSDPRVTQPAVQRSYLVPSYATAQPGEGEALDVLAEILGGGTTSRLYRDLVVDKAVATSAGAYYNSDALDDTSFSFFGVPRGDVTLKQLEVAIDDEIARLAASGVTEEEVAAAKNRMIAGVIYAEDSAEGVARVIGTALATGSTLAETQTWPAAVEAVTPAEVAAAARKYLDIRRSVTGYLVGEPKQKSILIQEKSKMRLRGVAVLIGLILAPLALAGSADAVTIERVVSPMGIEAWLVEEKTVPVIAVSFAFDGGSSQDPAGKAGVANMLSGLLDEGAGDLDSEAFQGALDKASIDLSFDAGHDSFSGSLRTLAENREEAVRLTRLALSEPRFDAEPVERIRAQIVTRIRANEQDPGDIASRSMMTALFPGHPYGRRNEGTADSVAAIAVDDLKTYKGKVLARDNLKVAVVGDIDAATLGPMLDDLFGGLPVKANLVPVPEVDREPRRYDHGAHGDPADGDRDRRQGPEARRSRFHHRRRRQLHPRRRQLLVAALHGNPREARPRLFDRSQPDPARPCRRRLRQHLDALRPGRQCPRPHRQRDQTLRRGRADRSRAGGRQGLSHRQLSAPLRYFERHRRPAPRHSARSSRHRLHRPAERPHRRGHHRGHPPRLQAPVQRRRPGGGAGRHAGDMRRWRRATGGCLASAWRWAAAAPTASPIFRCSRRSTSSG